MLTRTHPRRGIAALRRFVQSQPVGRCELCAVAIAESHLHLLEPANGRLLCACLACAHSAGARPQGRFGWFPAGSRRCPSSASAKANGMRSACRSTWPGCFTAPQPGGRLRSTPVRPARRNRWWPPDAWAALVARNPVLSDLESDVEGLLVNRISGRRGYYRVPIDRCYELVGLIRTQWRGWSGGDAAWHAIDEYFTRLAPTKDRAA